MSGKNGTRPAEGPPREPIAIVGIGCRFPGGVDGPEALWRLMANGIDAITEVPPERFDIDRYYDPRPGTPGRLVTRWGGFIPEVDHFDAGFFDHAPREAVAMDPQQRLLLEVSWEAVEDAGHTTARLQGGRGTGVFVGMITSDYRDLLYREPERLDIHVNAGNTRSVMAGRVSYALGLQGPSVVVDTACSSSLVAVHLACQSLWSGECEEALAAGVNLVLQPEESITFSRAGMLSPEGRCRFGDARGNGFVRSDGVGVLVLVPLSKALAAGDRIYAVIRGSAVNNDGRGSGFLLTPSKEGQAAVVRAACHSAGLSPGDISYVEAHGTGTHVGDPVEIGALGAVLAEGRPAERPCVLGSVKTNIGHTEGAAGVAGVIKAALCLQRRAIPPSLHFEVPNPDIPWKSLPVTLWAGPGPRDFGPGMARAGVSSFGLSGTNAHVVLEEPPRAASVEEEEAERAQLLALSARTRPALEELARRHRELLGSRDVPGLVDVCYTAAVRRNHHEYRLAIVGRSAGEMRAALDSFLQGQPAPGVSAGTTLGAQRPKVAFVFPGQGAQWLGMGQKLMDTFPVFAETLEEVERAMRPHVDWSLREQLRADASSSRLAEIAVVQPTLFAVQVALASLWRSWGVEPDAVVGHSMGEAAAAYVAGALTLEDAVRVICLRSQLLTRVRGAGAMALVELPGHECEHLVAAFPGRVAFAVSSSPSSSVLSGEVVALEEILAGLAARDVFCKLIKVDVASHSPQMEPLLEELIQVLAPVRPRAARVPLYSTVTGAVADGAELDARYWARNLRQPVLFSQAVRRQLEDGHSLFLELSPHPLLAQAIQQTAQHAGLEAVPLASMRREESEEAVMLDALGALHVRGVATSLERLHGAPRSLVRLPPYPWQRERYWPESAPERKALRGGHPLLGEHLPQASRPGTHLFQTEVGPSLESFLEDHRVQGSVVLPGAAYAEMVLAAARQLFGPGPHTLREVKFTSALGFPERCTRRVQLQLSRIGTGAASFQIFSLGEGADAAPTPHATGTLLLSPASEAPAAHPPERLRKGCPQAVSREEHLRAMRVRGLDYGPCFEGLEEVWRGEAEALGRLRLPPAVTTGAYLHHPVLLDACWQVFLAALPSGEGRPIAVEDTYVPVGFDTLCIRERLEAGQWCHVRLERLEAGPHEEVRGEVRVLGEGGHEVMAVQGLRFQRLGRAAGARAGQPGEERELLPRWIPRELPETAGGDGAGGWLLLADGAGVAEALREELESQGGRCVLVRRGETSGTDFERLLREVLPAGVPLRGVVHLWSLDAGFRPEGTCAALEADEALGCGSALGLVQALAKAELASAPRLWLVTGGVQAPGPRPESISVSQAPIWGFGRVLRYEHPSLRCTLVDVSGAPGPEDARALAEELLRGGAEDEVALRGQQRWVARLEKLEGASLREALPPLHARGRGHVLESTQPGTLESLRFVEQTPTAPAPGEVRLRVKAAGLNFRDVMKALGVYPDPPSGPLRFGDECAGTVDAVGEGVTGFEVGEPVAAIRFHGSFGSHVSVDARLVARKPERMSFAEAAAAPIAWLTAHYALHHLGRLTAGDRVLIHAAAGGVGLAAVRLCQRVGAEVFATAGSPRKRAWLESLGVKHVLDSRSFDFAAEVMRRTGGRGVDIALNSLAGEFISRTLEVLAPCGRFVEIGKRDIYEDRPLGMRALRNNVSFCVVDVEKVWEQRPELVAASFHEVMGWLRDGSLPPLPVQQFGGGDVVEAFRHMAAARHMGKVALSLEAEDFAIAPAPGRPVEVHADGTYLITGGLGGLGLAVAGWLVEQGARSLALVGRRGATAEAESALRALRACGATVRVFSTDVADEQQVAGLFAEVRASLPPLRGIVHAAGLLDDGVLTQLDWPRFVRVAAPKLQGAWNLHKHSQGEPLDFFALFSSAASLLGSPGQANYAAANAFMDALAFYRRVRGLPAQSLAWGPWDEVGLAVRPERRERLAARGLGSLSVADGLTLFGRALRANPVQVGLMELDATRWGQSYPGAGDAPRFSALTRSTQAPAQASMEGNHGPDAVFSASAEEREGRVTGYLREQLSRILRRALPQLEPHRPLKSLGLDSLMAVELKNRIEVELRVPVSVSKILLEGASLVQLSKQILDGLPPPNGGTDGEEWLEL